MAKNFTAAQIALMKVLGTTECQRQERYDSYLYLKKNGTFKGDFKKYLLTAYQAMIARERRMRSGVYLGD